MMILVIAILIMTVLTFTASVLCLSACGHALNRQALLSEQLSELLHETQFQSRVTRKALVSELRKVEGYKEPEKSPLEKAWSQLEAGEEPDIFNDFGKIGGSHAS